MILSNYSNGALGLYVARPAGECFHVFTWNLKPPLCLLFTAVRRVLISTKAAWRTSEIPNQLKVSFNLECTGEKCISSTMLSCVCCFTPRLHLLPCTENLITSPSNYQSLRTHNQLIHRPPGALQKMQWPQVLLHTQEGILGRKDLISMVGGGANDC